MQRPNLWWGAGRANSSKKTSAHLSFSLLFVRKDLTEGPHRSTLVGKCWRDYMGGWERVELAAGLGASLPVAWSGAPAVPPCPHGTGAVWPPEIPGQ